MRIFPSILLLLLAAATALPAQGVGASAWVYCRPGGGSSPEFTGAGLASSGVTRYGQGRYRVYLNRTDPDTAFSVIASSSDLNVYVSATIEAHDRVLVEVRDINSHQLREGPFTLMVTDEHFTGSGTGAYAWLLYAPGVIVAQSDSGLAHPASPVTQLGIGRYRVFLARNRADMNYGVIVGSCNLSTHVSALIESPDQILVEQRDATTDQLTDGAFTLAVIDSAYRDGVRPSAWAYYRPRIDKPDEGRTAGFGLTTVQTPIERIATGRYRVYLDRTKPSQNFGVVAGACDLGTHVSAVIQSSYEILVEVRGSETGALADGAFSLVVFETDQSRSAVEEPRARHGAEKIDLSQILPPAQH
jgi:hypothetical protein